MLLLWTLLVAVGAACALLAEHYALPAWRVAPQSYVLGTATLLAAYAVWALLAPVSTPPITTVLCLFVITALGGAADVAAYSWDTLRGR